MPSESSFSIKPTCVELRLKKASSVRWKALERPQHSPGITVTNSNSSQLTNHIQKHSHQPTNQNADDSMLNDLSVDSNSSPHPNSHATTFEPHNDVTMMSHQRKEPYSSVPQGGSYPSPSSTLNQTSAYSSQYPPTTPKLSPSQIPLAAMETTDPSYRNNQLCRPSCTGLCNFANNCFMNSVVQCLSNTRELRDYFIEGRYLADINTTNPLGFKGELAKCYSGIIRKLWSGEYEYRSVPLIRPPILYTTSSLKWGEGLYSNMQLVSNTSVDAKHHGASLSERWDVRWVGNNSICTHIKLQLSK